MALPWRYWIRSLFRMRIIFSWRYRRKRKEKALRDRWACKKRIRRKRQRQRASPMIRRDAISLRRRDSR